MRSSQIAKAFGCIASGKLLDLARILDHFEQGISLGRFPICLRNYSLRNIFVFQLTGTSCFKPDGIRRVIRRDVGEDCSRAIAY